MAYYVKATRNGKSIKLPVEDKHKYVLGVVNADYYMSSNVVNPVVRLFKSVKDPTITTNISSNLGSTSVGTCINNSNQVILLSAGSTFTLDKPGVSGLDEFIGDKIYLKSITYTVSIMPIIGFFEQYLKFLYDSNIYTAVSYATGSDHITQMTTPVINMAPPKPISINMRLMLIKFNSGLTSGGYGDVNNGLLKDSDDNLVNINVDAVKSELAHWFNQSHIYLESSKAYQMDTVNNVDDEDAHLNECVQPVFTDRLRDSCKWSGKFKILWDEKIQFTGKPLYFDKSFTINKNCNMEEVEIANSQGGTTNKYVITGNTLKHTYLVLFGPGCGSVDMCEPLHKFVNSSTGSYSDALRVFVNTKYTYYDI